MASSDSTRNEHIVIIGSGFAGLCMGIRLKAAGIDDFTILEQADEVGGTWRDNHYPGAACDVPSHLYSFSFEPYPEWTRMFAPQREILEYVKHCTDKYGLRPHIRLRSRVVRAVFDEASGLWSVHTESGEVFVARVVVSGTGPLNRPSVPDIRGVETFEGKSFHSSRWDHAFDLAGKTVAVIGTGASAIQIVPSIAPIVRTLHVFQRTPAWIMPRPDRAIGPSERVLFRKMPWLQQLFRYGLYWQLEARALAFVVQPKIMELARREGIRFIHRSVRDPLLREKLTPDYVPGCKRILISNDFYPAIARENVELVTDGIEEIRPRGILTRDGRERHVDAIVYSTGFHAAESVAPFEIRGRDGRVLDEVWRDGAEAYLGTSVTGFPNLFMVIGPNTGLGHNSMVFMIESQVQYVLDAIRTIRARRLKSVDVRSGAQQRFNAALHERMKHTVWSSGCASWYQTRSGKNTTLWPGFTVEYRLRTRRFDPAPYELTAH